jgi:glucosamine-6-phosphate deaminase
LIRKSIPKDKKILIFSPHPDDDVVGMGATIHEIIKNNNVYRIVYLTYGERGVRGDISNQRKREIRRKEAISAIEILGGSKENLEFLDLRFYYSGWYSSEDIDKVFDLITIYMPDIIYVCIDNDPNSTHKKCAEIIDEALVQYPLDSIIYCYTSIWSIFSPKETNAYISFNEELMSRKIEAIKAHKSQEHPLYLKGKKPLWQKVKEKDKKLAKKLQIHEPYCEGFVIAKRLFK